jgi:hypothetical protein
MIVHLWNRYPLPDEETRRRHSVAQASWSKQLWIELPVSNGDLSRHMIDGGRRLPYVKDLFDASAKAQDEADIAVFSNTDIGFCSDAAMRIAFYMQSNDAGYANRRDFPKLLVPPVDVEIGLGTDYSGTDVFFFRVSWWLAVRDHFPDMLLGREAWDACMRVLVEETNSNKPLTFSNLCWHERHGGAAYWEDSKNRYTLPGQIYNLRLAKVFIVGMGQNPAKYGIRNL